MSDPDSQTVEKLLESIGLLPSFLDELMHDSDWSFVIKLHALFEAVLGTLIVRRLGTRAAEEVIANLDFNNTKTGKVAFARALGLIEKKDVAFLRGLSELRNQLVHKVHNVGFTFRQYVENLEASGLKKFKSEFGYVVCGLENGETEYLESLARNPKSIVFLAAYGCMLSLQFRITGHAVDALVKALMNQTKT